MAWSFSMRAIITGEPNAAPRRKPLSDSVLDGPRMVMIFSPGTMPSAHRCA